MRYRVGATASLSVFTGNQELTLSTSGAFGPELATLTFNLNVKQYLEDYPSTIKLPLASLPSNPMIGMNLAA